MTDQAQPIADGSAGHLSRRYVLRGVAATGAVLAASTLAACGDSGNNGASSSDTTSPPTTGGSTPGESSSPPATGGGGDALAKTSDIPVGGGKIFPDKRVVVTQPGAGNFKCFSAVCTHQGCVVSSVEDGVIKCPCHGSQYAIADASVVAGPAPAPLPSEKISVEGNKIFLA
ncbi:MAG TPA: Rieske (2Fe-2S) protein [Actinomycetes bacterium]|nr:Rieske (2Fe-2S) protein [Actinomycetes bacterium]